MIQNCTSSQKWHYFFSWMIQYRNFKKTKIKTQPLKCNHNLKRVNIPVIKARTPVITERNKDLSLTPQSDQKRTFELLNFLWTFRRIGWISSARRHHVEKLYNSSHQKKKRQRGKDWMTASPTRAAVAVDLTHIWKTDQRLLINPIWGSDSVNDAK